MDYKNYVIDGAADERKVSVKLEGGVTPKWYQIEMIGMNPEIKLIEPVYVQRDDGEYITYLTGKRFPLKEFLMNHDLSSIDIYRIVRGIARSLLSVKEYLLEESGLIIFEELIYIGTEIDDIYMLYYPAEDFCSEFEDLKNMILRVITLYAYILPENDGYLAHLLNYLKTENLDSSKIFDFCDSMLRRSEQLKAVFGPEESTSEQAETKEIKQTSYVNKKQCGRQITFDKLLDRKVIVSILLIFVIAYIIHMVLRNFTGFQV